MTRITAYPVYAVVYWEKVNQRWVTGAKYPTEEQANAKAQEIRRAGYEARVEGRYS